MWYAKVVYELHFDSARGNRWKGTAKGKHDWRSYAILLATFGSIHLGTFSRLVATQPTRQELCSQPQHDDASIVP